MVVTLFGKGAEITQGMVVGNVGVRKFYGVGNSVEMTENRKRKGCRSSDREERIRKKCEENVLVIMSY